MSQWVVVPMIRMSMVGIHLLSLGRPVVQRCLGSGLGQDCPCGFGDWAGWESGSGVDKLSVGMAIVGGALSSSS